MKWALKHLCFITERKKSEAPRGLQRLTTSDRTMVKWQNQDLTSHIHDFKGEPFNLTF